MAQKKKKNTPAGESDLSRTVVTSIRVKAGHWQALRLLCLLEHRSIGEVIEEMVEKWTGPQYLEMGYQRSLKSKKSGG